MQDEATWMSGQSAEESAAKERYEYFTRPEPRENMSDIFTIDDEYLGPDTKVRDVRIGMTRNAAEENKRTVRAYLEPFPHIRIEDAKQLQGWYQSKVNESKQSRPRPCFTEAILTEPYGGYCLPPDSRIDTPRGTVRVVDLRPGDILWGVKEGRIVPSEILATVNRWCESGLIALTTEDGDELNLTAEHPVFSVTRGDYIPAGEIYVGEKIEARSMQELREAGRQFTNEHFSVLSGVSVPPATNVGARIRKERSDRGSMDLRSTELRRTMFNPVSESMLELRGRSTTKPREDAKGKVYSDEGDTKNTGGSSETSSSSDGEEAFSRDEGAVRGAGETGDNGSEEVEKESVCMPSRKSVQSPIILGEKSSGVFRSEKSGLGLRTCSYIPTKRERVSTGLSAGGRIVHRSEGVYGTGRLGEDRGSERNGVYSSRMGSEEIKKTTHSTVVRISHSTTPLRVYDLQTTTGNFLLRGSKNDKSFHVHNCAVGCQFCYINSGMRGYRGTGLISVPLNYGEQIAVQLSKMRRSAAGYFSSFTDPFTPLENYYHNTQRAAEEFVKVGLPIFFLSRLRYPKWAIELLTKNPHSYAQKSINTCDAEDWRRLSPGALPLKHHLQEITALKKRGIYVSIQCNPILPGVTTNDQILRLFTMLKEAGADHVIVKFVEAAYSWAPAMVERIRKVFGEERGGAFEALFTQNIGAERTIDEAYRIRAHKIYSTHARRIGLTYATCYEYRYERDEKGKVLSKVGVSIGREFTTASQCHGHTVPMYARSSAEESFLPVEECPPSGCLYCADENEGKPRCGDELAGQAKALKLSDLRVPMGERPGGDLLQLGVIKR